MDLSAHVQEDTEEKHVNVRARQTFIVQPIFATKYEAITFSHYLASSGKSMFCKSVSKWREVRRGRWRLYMYLSNWMEV